MHKNASDLRVGSSCSPPAPGFGRNWINSPAKWNYLVITPESLQAGLYEGRRKVHMEGSAMALRCPYFSLRLFPESQVVSLIIQTMSQILHGLFSMYENNRGRSWTAFIICIDLKSSWGASQVALVVKNPPANAGDVRDAGSIPGLGKSSGGGHGNPPQYSCLENPHGQRSLAGYSLWGHKELDTTEVT